jgi:riboflavin biosynthesis pyrimidine reductase
MIQETAPWLSEAEAREVAEQAHAIARAVEQVILGKSDTVRLDDYRTAQRRTPAD